MRTIAAISILTLLSAGVLIPDWVAAQDDSTTSLGNAVEAFNERASANAIGKHQPPLTEDEVVASIWGWIRDYGPPVSDHVYAIFQKIAETRKLPEGIKGEEMTLLVGSIPIDDKKVNTTYHEGRYNQALAKLHRFIGPEGRAPQEIKDELNLEWYL